jgi:hypothetical protein
LQELLYVPPTSETIQHKTIGDGHTRQCKDFSKLEEWAMEHTACYTFEPVEPPFFEDQRYANCPEDSPYYQAMKEAIGAGRDWKPIHPPKKGPTFQI